MGKEHTEEERRAVLFAEDPAAPRSHALVMDPISRLPEMYFIKNHSRDVGHGSRDSWVAPRLEQGDESKRPWRPEKRERVEGKKDREMKKS